jgi:hypothetical protein
MKFLFALFVCCNSITYYFTTDLEVEDNETSVTPVLGDRVQCFERTGGFGYSRLGNPALGYHRAAAKMNAELPSWVASVHSFMVHFVSFGLPLVVIMYVSYSAMRAPSGMASTVACRLLGGVETQAMYFLGASAYLIFIVAVGMPVMAASRDEVGPWTMFTISMLVESFSVGVILNMFGLKLCKLRGFQGYGRRATMMQAQADEGQLADALELGTLGVNLHTGSRHGGAQIPIRRIMPEDESKEYSGCVVSLERGASDILQMQGRPWASIVSDGTVSSTEIRLLIESGLVANSNGKVFVTHQPDVGEVHAARTRYSCKRHSDMRDLLWELLHNGKRVKGIFVYDRTQADV